jgi:hypothetical protein
MQQYSSPADVDLSFTRDPLFTFDEKRHLYRYAGKILDSVSKVKRELSVPFDKKRIAGYVARREGRTVKAVLAEWEDKRDRASRRGDMVHACVERFLQTGEMPPLPAGHSLDADDEWDVKRRLQEFQEWHAANMTGLVIVGCEVQVYSLELGIAGTLDTLALREGYLYVGDWKTNGKFRTDGDGSKVYNNLLGPFRDLPDNEYNKFSLQVSLYRIILREHGIHTKGGFIVHLPEEGTPQVHKARDLRRPLWDYLAA